MKVVESILGGLAALIVGVLVAVWTAYMVIQLVLFTIHPTWIFDPSRLGEGWMVLWRLTPWG